MAERKYGEGVNIYTEPGRVSDMMLEIDRILKPSGIVLKFGFNSTRHISSWEPRGGYLVEFGGNRNCVVISAWKKTQRSLSEF